MLIYIFAEHYPNPYKPQFDTEFAYFIREGHDIHIFAGGSYTSIIQPRVHQYQLDKKTEYFVTNGASLKKNLSKLIRVLVRYPRISLSRVGCVWNQNLPVRNNLKRVARALLLPFSEPDVCYVHNLATANYLDFLNSLYPNSRHAMYFHGGEVGGVTKVEKDREIFSRMDIVFANTRFCREQTILRGCLPERSFVVPVGFDLDDYPDIAERTYRPKGLLRLVSIGRLGEEKGIQYSLDALRMLKASTELKFKYQIVGKGLEEAALRKLTEEHGLGEDVEFLGLKTKDQVVHILAESDALILPSIETATWAETQGAVVQEAMFMKNIIISTTAGGVPECIPPAMKRFSVPPADAKALATRIQEVAALSNSDFESIGSAARAFTEQRFDIEKTGQMLLGGILAR